MERFEGAFRMAFRDGYSGVQNENEFKKLRSKLVVVDKHMKKPSRKDLVYLDDSPDYCERNQQ